MDCGQMNNFDKSDKIDNMDKIEKIEKIDQIWTKMKVMDKNENNAQN